MCCRQSSRSGSGRLGSGSSDLGPGAACPLPAPGHYATGSDWQPATPAWRTAARSFFQPVEILAPQGGRSHWRKEALRPGSARPVRAGMLIGQVYRFRVTNIPLHPGLEVYPTGSRQKPALYAARPGTGVSCACRADAGRHRIGADGKFVTRVVYLEDPGHGVASGPRPDGSELGRGCSRPRSSWQSPTGWADRWPFCESGGLLPTTSAGRPTVPFRLPAAGEVPTAAC